MGARGLLMLMPSLLLIPTTMVDSMDMVWATMVATVLDTMDWDMSMARGLLMLMPSLLLIPTMAMSWSWIWWILWPWIWSGIPWILLGINPHTNKDTWTYIRIFSESPAA